MFMRCLVGKRRFGLYPLFRKNLIEIRPVFGEKKKKRFIGYSFAGQLRFNLRRVVASVSVRAGHAVLLRAFHVVFFLSS